MIDLSNEPAVYEKEIHYNEDRHEKIFLTVNTFRGTEYISLRKFYTCVSITWTLTRNGSLQGKE